MTQAKTTETKTSGKTKGAAGSAGAAYFTQAQDAFESFFRAGSEAMSGNFDKWIALNQERFGGGLTPFQNWDDFAQLGRENLEAWMASTRIATKGFEAIAEKVAGCLTATMESGMASSKAILECRDIKAFVDLQTKQMRDTVDSFVAEGTELSEMSVETATKAIAPLNERVNATVERWSKTAA